MKRLLQLLLLSIALCGPMLGTSGATVPECTTPCRIDAVGNASATSFAYTFKIQDSSHLKVYLDGVLQTLSVDYTVTGVGASGGGTVVFTSAPGSNVDVTILRDVPTSQDTNYVDGDPFPADATENALDLLHMKAQEQDEVLNRSLKLKPEVTGFNTEFTPVAGKCIGANVAGTGIDNFDCSGGGGGGGGTGDLTDVLGTSGEITITNPGGPQPQVGIDSNLNLSTKVLQGGTPLVLEGSTSDANETSVVVTDPTADRTFTIPNANSVAVQSSTAGANQFATGVSSQGAVSYAQPSFSNLSGTVTDAQVPNDITIDLATFATSATTATALAANAANCASGSGAGGVDASGAAENCTNYMEEPSGNGIVARTAANTSINRTITGTAGNITVANGDGVSGNPTIDLGTNAATKAGVQAGGYLYCADAEADDDYTCSVTPALTAYTTGMTVVLVPNTNNTGASTLDIDTLGPKAIKTFTGGDPGDGELVADRWYALFYDGTNFRMHQDIQDAGGAGITSLGGQTGSTQTFSNDTNVTITSSADNHALGWTGTLAKARQNAQTAYYDDATPTFTNDVTADIIGNSTGVTGLTASRALQSSAGGALEPSSVTSAELGHLSGVTSAIQTQINGKVALSGSNSIGAINTFTGDNAFSDGDGLKVRNSADNTKIGRFDASTITTATTRTYILPNKNGTLATTDDLGAGFDPAGNFTLTGNWLWDTSGGAELAIEPTAVAGLPTAPVAGTLAIVTDALDATSCEVAGGSTEIACRFDGTNWVSIGGITDHGALAGLSDDDHSAIYSGFETGAGAPSAGTVNRNGFFYFDTTNSRVYAGYSAAGNYIDIGDQGDAVNQLCFDADCETAVGSDTGTLTSSNGFITGSVSKASDTITTDLDLAAKMKTKNIVFRVGSSATGATALADTDDEVNFYQNELAAMTVTQVKCWTNTGTSTINVQRNDENILSSNLTCTTSGATGTIDTNADDIAVGHLLDFIMVTAAASGTPTMVTVNLKVVLD